MLSVSEALSSDEDAVGIGRKGTINSPYILKAPFWTVDTLFYAIPKLENDLQFIYTIFQKINWKQFNESTGVPSLSKSTINSVQAYFPISEIEQQLIGNLFQTLDSLITAQKRKIELLKQLKKGYLQKIFSQQIRFSGFTQSWSKHKLEKIFIKGGSGGTPLSTNKEFYKGNIPFLSISDISSSNGFIYDTEKHISQEAINNSSAWLVPAGAISLAMYASVGKLAILMVDAATSQAFYNMVFDNSKTRDFIYQYLLQASDNGKWNSLISTGTQANLNAEKVKNFEILIPLDLNEQKLIGQFFQNLDLQISQANQKLSALTELKKSYLQQMFI